MSKLIEEDDDEDVLEMFSKVNPVYDFNNLKEDEPLKRILTGDLSKRFASTPKTAAMRLGTSSGVKMF